MTGADATPLWSHGAARSPLVPPRDFVPFSAADADRDLFACFTRAVERAPEALALVAGGCEWTYAELHRRALSIAAFIRAECGANATVALLVGPDEFAAAAFGALACGATFVPFDPALPAALLADALRASGAGLVLHDGSLRATSGIRCAALDSIELAASFAADRVDLRARACVTFTSGSTGRPKGVAMSHRFLLEDGLRTVNDLRIAPSDRCDMLYAPSFSAALASLFSTLFAGASMHPLDVRAWLHRLPAWLGEQRITLSRMTSSMLRFVCGSCVPESTSTIGPALRLVSATGESLRAADVAAFRQTFAPGCVLRLGYGASETRSIAQSFFTADDPLPADPVPIGIGVVDREVTIIGDDGLPVTEGRPGRIIVTACRLADGYVGDDGDNSRFTRLADGRIRYETGDHGAIDGAGRLVLLGRTDGMVKVRGQRVEIEAIERALVSITGVEDAVVLAFTRSDGATGLAAFVVARTVEPAALRAELARRVDPAGVPERIVMLAVLPRNTNGKTDRRRLLEESGLAR